jgi:hypothetical protein
MREWFSDGRRTLATAIVFATVLGAWMMLYEQLGKDGLLHRNRLTGAVCHMSVSCWFCGDAGVYSCGIKNSN